MFYQSRTTQSHTAVAGTRTFGLALINPYSFVDVGGSGRQRILKTMRILIHGRSDLNHFAVACYYVQTHGTVTDSNGLSGVWNAEAILDQMINDTYGMRLLKSLRKSHEVLIRDGGNVYTPNIWDEEIIVPQDLLAQINQGADQERDQESYFVLLGIAYNLNNDTFVWNTDFEIFFEEKQRKIVTV